VLPQSSGSDYTASYPEDRASFLSVQMPQNQNFEQQ